MRSSRRSGQKSGRLGWRRKAGPKAGRGRNEGPKIGRLRDARQRNGLSLFASGRARASAQALDGETIERAER